MMTISKKAKQLSPNIFPETICSQPQQIGACFAFTNRWFYNTRTGNCEQFTYSGCLGNDNNFATYNDCSTRCSSTSGTHYCYYYYSYSYNYYCSTRCSSISGT